jgi:hypothetical protein
MTLPSAGSTHSIWLSSREFITAIGDYFYKFDVNDLSTAAWDEMTRSGRYICYGSMDYPGYGRRGEQRKSVSGI